MTRTATLGNRPDGGPSARDEEALHDPADAAPARPWCLFKCESRPFAVGLEAVAEVVDAERLVRLSLCPPQVLGLCTVRRDVVPILTLAPRPPTEQRDADTRLVALILRSEQGAWGVRIDREGTVVVDGVVDPSGAVTPEDGGPAIIGTLRRGDLAHAVIDPGRTWRSVRASVESWYKQ